MLKYRKSGAKATTDTPQQQQQQQIYMRMKNQTFTINVSPSELCISVERTSLATVWTQLRMCRASLVGIKANRHQFSSGRAQNFR